MAEVVIKPDLNFVRDVIATGGDSLKKCFQCGTCSVVCNLSPDRNTFPRRNMIFAQWGLKDRLAGDPNVWLCHQCNDCSTYCPRGARPGDVLAALRAQAIRKYAFPSFMAKAMADPKFLPMLLAIPVGLLIVILAATGKMHIPEGSVHYAEMFSHLVLNLFFGGLFFAMLGILLVGVIRFWRDMSANDPVGAQLAAPIPRLIQAAITTVKDIGLHSKFKDCEANKSRYWAHLLILYGFVGLFIVTGVAVLYILVGFEYPLPLFHPWKILGNLSALALLVGLVLAIVNRLNAGDDQKSSYLDWLLLGTILLLAVTGALVEAMRYADMSPIAYYTYFVHLVAVFMLLIYLPYSKFAHLVYRTVAMFYSNFTAQPEEAGQAEVKEAA